MYSDSLNVFAVPGSIDTLDSNSVQDAASSLSEAGSLKDKGYPMIIGLFGSDGGGCLKNRFFDIMSGDVLPMKERSSSLIQRVQLSGDNYNGKNIQLWKFPSLHEGEWLQKAEAFLCVTAHLKQCAGKLHGVICMHEIDEDEDDMFQSLQSLIGHDFLTQFGLVVSSEPIEPINDLNDIPLAARQVILPGLTHNTCAELIEQFLEPRRDPPLCTYQLEYADGKPIGNTTAGRLFSERLTNAQLAVEYAFNHIHGRPVSSSTTDSPKLPSPRRRLTTTTLKAELNQTRRRLDEIQEAYAMLEENCAEQTAQLEAQNHRLHTENDNTRAELDALKNTLDEIQAENAQEVETQERTTQTEPVHEAKPTREELQSEVLELKHQLDKAKLDEATATKQVASLSKELTNFKSSLADAQRANNELKKKVVALEKQAETSVKATEMRKEEAAKAKIETTQVNLQLKSIKDDLEKAQRQLKEYTSSRVKIEDERAKAISVSEGLLKIKDGIENQLTEAKSCTDTIKQQAAVEISQLKESLAEKESQIRDIAHAAGTWALASTEAKRLNEELRLLQDCTDARDREAHRKHLGLQVEFRQAKEEWEAERMRLETTISSLNQGNEEARDRLEVVMKERDDEANGYMERITELDEWCEQRWDAVGNNCIIA